MTSREFQDRISRRARRAGVSLSPALKAKLDAYFQLLALWNQKINLSGLDLADPAPEALDRLLIEPLAAAKYAPPGTMRIIDIGSGGGSPAIPFALGIAASRLLMVESKVRKSVFLKEVARTLEMPHCDVATARFEELLSRPDLHEAHDILTIRAVRVEPRVLMTLQTFVKPRGQMFLFRGSHGTTGPETVAPPLSWRATYPLVESLRSRLVVLEKAEAGDRR